MEIRAVRQRGWDRVAEAAEMRAKWPTVRLNGLAVAVGA